MGRVYVKYLVKELARLPAFLSPKMAVVCTTSRDKIYGLSKMAVVCTNSRDKIRSFPCETCDHIASFLHENCMEVDLSRVNMNLNMFRFIIDNLIFPNPTHAVYQGQRYRLRQDCILPVTTILGFNIPPSPYVPPYVIPNTYTGREVSYVHVILPYGGGGFGTIANEIKVHARNYGLNSVIFKGMPLNLLRGIGYNGRDTGPRVTSLIGRDRCVVALPTVARYLLKDPFNMQELLDGHWAMHFLKSHGYQSTIPRIDRILFLDGILHVEINWRYAH